MALCKRVIPVMLTKGSQLVKGRAFRPNRVIGQALQAMRINAARGADELVLLDVTATAEGRGPDLDLVRELSESVFVPLTVGGGVRSCGDIDKLLRAGADKVCIGSAAWELADLVPEAAARFGRQAISVAVDVRGGKPTIRCGTVAMDVPTVGHYAKMMEEAGAGEIVLTSVDRDGKLNGYDLVMISDVARHLGIPVIAAGGCGTPQDMHWALEAGADAVAAGAMFAFTDHTPKSCAQYLRDKGWAVRL